MKMRNLIGNRKIEQGTEVILCLHCFVYAGVIYLEGHDGCFFQDSIPSKSLGGYLKGTDYFPAKGNSSGESEQTGFIYRKKKPRR
jgi:hypothetical protein